MFEYPPKWCTYSAIWLFEYPPKSCTYTAISLLCGLCPAKGGSWKTELESVDILQLFHCLNIHPSGVHTPLFGCLYSHQNGVLTPLFHCCMACALQKGDHAEIKLKEPGRQSWEV